MILAALLTIALGCSETESSLPLAGAGMDRAAAFRPVDNLAEVQAELEAGGFALYVAARRNIADGAPTDALLQAIADDPTRLGRTAAVLLEDRMIDQTLASAAQPVLQAIAADAQGGVLRPMAIRILGRMTRGANTGMLLQRLDQETDPTTRAMLIAAVGDNADAGAVEALQDRFAAFAACDDARMALISLNQGRVVAGGAQLDTFLTDQAAPRLLDCAAQRADDANAIHSDLGAFVLAFKERPSVSLIQHVLAGDSPPEVKRQALLVLRPIIRTDDAELFASVAPMLEDAGLGQLSEQLQELADTRE